MAIKKTLTTNFGLDVDAYMRVENITFHEKTNLRFVLKYYAKPVGYPAFQEQNFLFEYDLNGENAYVQAYKYLKSLEQFEHAVDC